MRCLIFLLSLHKVYSLLNFEFSLDIDSIKDYCEEFTERRVILKTLKTLNICMCSALKPSERRKRGCKAKEANSKHVASASVLKLI